MSGKRAQYVGMPEAVSQLGLGQELTRDQLCDALHDGLPPRSADDVIVAVNEAVDKLLEAGRQGQIAVEATLHDRDQLNIVRGSLDTQLTKIACGKFRLYDPERGRLYAGTGLFLIPGAPMFEEPTVTCYYDNVLVERAGPLAALNAQKRRANNRQLDHKKIIDSADSMLTINPDISLTSTAASIVADLPPNPKTGKPRDQRHIERLIDHLWGGGIAKAPP
jgi:hypothetical protein